MTLAIIQCRLGSSRLPKKALSDLNMKPVIWHVVSRARQIRGVDRVTLAVPSLEDAYALAGATGCMCYAALSCAETNVLGRFAACAEYHDADVIMRLTGDCPLLEPAICEQVLALYHSDPKAEYASNVCEGYIDGTDCEVFSREALRWADREATDPSDREHVTPWIRRHVRGVVLPPAFDAKGLKTSIDVPADLERVRALMETA